MTRLETVRELVALYHIAVTSEVTAYEDGHVPYRDAYRWLATDLHRAIACVTRSDDPRSVIDTVAALWTSRAHWAPPGLYATWAKNLRSIA